MRKDSCWIGCFMALLLLLSGCKKNSEGDALTIGTSFVRGADVSWLTEQERDGILFYTDGGESKECMSLLKENGLNSVRLRVWVNHSTGWCNKEDVLIKAQRAKGLGLRLMIDFHYSDNFADPSKQALPLAWEGMTFEELCVALSNHTQEVLSLLKEHNIEPEWVQIGNETRNGMLWAVGRINGDSNKADNGWKNYATLTTRGYEAAKSVFPKTKVVVHIDNAYQDNRWFFSQLRRLGGKWDIIGLSHYPMMKEWSGKDWQEMNRLAQTNIIALNDSFKCPILLCEIGIKPDNDSLATAVITDIKTKLDTLDFFNGFFYWEPQCYGGWRPAEYIELGWNSYEMGAFTVDGKPSQALKKLWE